MSKWLTVKAKLADEKFSPGSSWVNLLLSVEKSLLYSLDLTVYLLWIKYFYGQKMGMKPFKNFENFSTYKCARQHSSGHWLKKCAPKNSENEVNGALACALLPSSRCTAPGAVRPQLELPSASRSSSALCRLCASLRVSYFCSALKWLFFKLAAKKKNMDIKSHFLW